VAIMSALHFAGVLGGSEPFQPRPAGIAEATIGIALAYGAAMLLRRSPNRRPVALAANGFAIVGFIVGLSFTARGGGAIDLAYHATVLPLLLLTFGLLLRQTPWSREGGRGGGTGAAVGGGGTN